MEFPLTVTFKVVSLTSQVTVTDATGTVLFFVRQKRFRLREKVEIFSDDSRQRLVASLEADRILDFSPEYALRDPAGVQIGAIKRNGGRSLWRADYDIAMGGQQVAKVSEVNPWTKFLDGLFGEIPVVGLLSGYLFHPAYKVDRVGGGPRLVTMTKQPALFESRLTVSAEDLAGWQEYHCYHLAMLLMVTALLERDRG